LEVVRGAAGAQHEVVVEHLAVPELVHQAELLPGARVPELARGRALAGARHAAQQR